MNIAQAQCIKEIASHVTVYDLELLTANIHFAHTGDKYLCFPFSISRLQEHLNSSA